ncbi:cytochrome c family protein [Limibacillus sp. MBR-115]|jgi:cytochrome c|uniref:c-type cytochrome n=1 Tax=Limibacillus sp. MBR-115 TaxID=3156465 RepID=UPI00339A6DC9
MICRLLMTGLLLGVLQLIAGASSAQNDLDARLAAADPAAGEKVFRACKACHTIDEGGKNRVGPNLWGIIGADVAASKDYANYSKALRDLGGSWTMERLDEFLADPRKFVKGTRMTFTGVSEAAARADLIAYLNASGPTPTSFGSGQFAPNEQDSTTAPPELFGVLVPGAGAEETYYNCTACHSERIVAQQGLSRDNWAELLDWMVEEQGMSELDQQTKAVILDYLSKNYGEDRPNFTN